MRRSAKSRRLGSKGPAAPAPGRAGRPRWAWPALAAALALTAACACAAIAAAPGVEADAGTAPAAAPAEAPAPAASEAPPPEPRAPETDPLEPAPADPTQLSAAQDKAEVLLKKEAFEVTRQLMEDFPNNADAIGLYGTVLNYYGQTAEAVKCWEKCIEINPRRADAYHAMAMVAWRKSDYPKAAELWAKAKEINPDLRGMYGRYGEALLEMGKPEEAIAAAEKELTLAPGSVDAYALLGKAYLYLRDYDKAAANFEKSRQANPDNSQSYHGLMAIAARQGHADKAKEYSALFQKTRAVEDAAAADRRRRASSQTWGGQVLARTCTDAGRLYTTARNAEKAEALWRRATDADPLNQDCRRLLVDLYRQSRRPREALSCCEQLVLLAPKNATYHLNAGALLGELQMFDAAEQAIRKAMELAPERPTAYRSLVRLLLFRRRSLPEALVLARRLVKMEPTAHNYSVLS
ncbi:MAG: tetratricopeptide repeat protein, partial [Planctomycetes bacterium]|nr:tetratricopeptide repeat protein [Planctomycetota bacterium]